MRTDSDGIELGECRIPFEAQPLQPDTPPPLSKLLRPRRRQLLEGGVEAGLERALPKEPRTECVNRPHERSVHRPDREVEASAGLGLRRRHLARLLEGSLETLSQLPGSLSSEGHSRDPLDLDIVVPDEGHHASHQRGRLPRARSRLDQDVPVQGRLDAGTGCGVGERHAPTLAERPVIPWPFGVLARSVIM